jgi:sugar/nucleoside kinase (ribokinase family)
MVTCIGEIIVDLVSEEPGLSLADTVRFKKLAGGAPANVAVGLARLGTRTAFVGRVGEDPFGEFLRKELAASGVDIEGISFDKEHKTRLAFVSLTETGDRDFEFWEASPADIFLLRSHIDLEKIKDSGIVHISSFMLLNEPARSTVVSLISEIKSAGPLISFDPNLRLSLWRSQMLAKQLTLKVIKFTDLLRLNRDEASFLTNETDIERAASKLLRMGPRLVVITLAERGCFYMAAKNRGYVDGFKIEVVDTTGCGDGFLAGLLHSLLHSEDKAETLNASEVSQICRYANAVGALVATRKGAMTALPTAEKVDEFLSGSNM